MRPFTVMMNLSCHLKTAARNGSLLVAWALAGLLAFSASALDLSRPEFGSADKPSRSLPQWINKQIESGVKKIVIPPGRYYVAPDDRIHLVLEGVRDVELIANGVEMVCTQTTRAIEIQDCENLTIRGLTIDYDPLPFTQGRIVEMSDDKRTLTIDLFAGYPAASAVRTDKCEIYDAKNSELKTPTYFNIEVQAVDKHRVNLIKPDFYPASRSGEEVGDIVVLNASNAPGASQPHAILSEGCRGLTLDRVTLYSSNSFGFFESDCESSRYRRCVVDRRPLATELTQRAYPRVRSINADAFHSKHGNSPYYQSCVAKYMGDDGFAINGDYNLVSGTDGKMLRVISKKGREIEISVGDPVQLVHADGSRLPDAKVLAIQEADSMSEQERRYVEDSRLIDDTKRRMLRSRHIFLLEIDRAVDLPIGSVIAAANRVGNGFQITACEVGPTRSRGILVKASDGIISGNTIRGTWGEAIKLAPEWQWMEAGSSNNVVIQSNKIRDIRSVGIAVYAESSRGEIAAAGAHRDITIRNNIISQAPSPAIVVTSTIGLVEENNRVTTDPSIELLWHNRLMRQMNGNEPAIYIVNP